MLRYLLFKLIFIKDATRHVLVDVHAPYLSYHRTLIHVGYPGGYCGSPGTVGTADGYCRVLWVLRVLWVSWVLRQYPWVLQGTVGTVGTARGKSDSWVLRQYSWVLQGTVGTVSTAGYWVLWVLHWVLWVLQVCTAGYCRVYRNLELWVLYTTLTGIETGFEISWQLIFRGDEITV